MFLMDDGLSGFVQINVSRYCWIENSKAALDDGAHSGFIGKDAKDAIDAEYKLLESLVQKIRGDCGIPCGSLCCFFNTPHASAPLSKEDLEILKGYAGPRLHRYCTFVPFDSFSGNMRDYLKKNMEFLHLVNGSQTACMINTKNTPVDFKKLPHRPIVLETGRIMWTGPESKACVFLDQNLRCSMQERGIKFLVCRNFVCSALLTVKTMEWLQIKSNPSSIAEINAAYHLIDSAMKAYKLVKTENDLDSKFRDFALDALNGRPVDPKGFAEYADSRRREIQDSIREALLAKEKLA